MESSQSDTTGQMLAFSSRRTADPAEEPDVAVQTLHLLARQGLVTHLASVGRDTDGAPGPDLVETLLSRGVFAVMLPDDEIALQLDGPQHGIPELDGLTLRPLPEVLSRAADEILSAGQETPPDPADEAGEATESARDTAPDDDPTPEMTTSGPDVAASSAADAPAPSGSAPDPRRSPSDDASTAADAQARAPEIAEADRGPAAPEARERERADEEDLSSARGDGPMALDGTDSDTPRDVLMLETRADGDPELSGEVPDHGGGPASRDPGLEDRLARLETLQSDVSRMIDGFGRLLDRFDQLEFVVTEQFTPEASDPEGALSGTLSERLERIEAKVTALEARQAPGADVTIVHPDPAAGDAGLAVALRRLETIAADMRDNARALAAHGDPGDRRIVGDGPISGTTGAEDPREARTALAMLAEVIGLLSEGLFQAVATDGRAIPEMIADLAMKQEEMNARLSAMAELPSDKKLASN